MNFQARGIRRKPIDELLDELLKDKGLICGVHLVVIKHGEPQVYEDLGEKIVKGFHRDDSDGLGDPDLGFIV